MAIPPATATSQTIDAMSIIAFAVWRKRLGVEPSLPAKRRATGFEDREGHRAPFTSIIIRICDAGEPPKWGDSTGRAVSLSSAHKYARELRDRRAWA